MKKVFIFSLLLAAVTLSFAQGCDCNANYQWLKKTFEENDAGFSHVLDLRGETAYREHCRLIAERAETVKTLDECTPILRDWLLFFRSGHIGIYPNRAMPAPRRVESEEGISDWETLNVEIEEFKRYLDQKITPDYEGIWRTDPYTVGIKRVGDVYVGFIVESAVEEWVEGQVKFKFSLRNGESASTFYMRDRSGVKSNHVLMVGRNHLELGSISLARLYPALEETPHMVQYLRSQKSIEPYLERLNETTLYLRIPSFALDFKPSIDSVLQVNEQEILTSENLIIDIRGNGGGSDASYRNILPYIYTNPTRTVGVEVLSSKLNNQRVQELVTNRNNRLSDQEREWAKNLYDRLEAHPGEFVNMHEESVSVRERDTIYPFPQNVGVIIDNANGSTAEQFLLEAKQSRKVKLFGITTAGVLDLSNMVSIQLPSGDFTLVYALTRSLRIPDFEIDNKGIQPDFYLDKDIPPHEWTEFVAKILNL